MIKFGIDKSYIPNWGITQAIREVYQNFIDYGEYKVDMEKVSSKHTKITITNSFQPKSLEFLKIGFTKKLGINAIGGHGEGLKLAGLIFLRKNLHFQISSPLGTLLPAWYDDLSIGKCYGLTLDKERVSKVFTITFVAETEDINCFTDSIITSEDIQVETTYGSILKGRDTGKVFIGGLYVCTIPSLRNSYNFKPSYVTIGRDREIPSSFDIHYYAGKLLNEASRKGHSISVKDLKAPEFQYETSFPKKVAEKFKPVVVEGEVCLASGKTVITDSATIRRLANTPIVGKRLAKVKYKVSLRKKPHTILKEFFKSIGLTGTQKARASILLKEAKHWKHDSRV